MGCNCSGGARIKPVKYFWDVYPPKEVSKEKPKKSRKKKVEEPIEETKEEE